MADETGGVLPGQSPEEKGSQSTEIVDSSRRSFVMMTAAHLTVSTLDQAQEETGLIETTFTQASDRP